jgi:hypothetical protein
VPDKRRRRENKLKSLRTFERLVKRAKLSYRQFPERIQKEIKCWLREVCFSEEFPSVSMLIFVFAFNLFH